MNIDVRPADALLEAALAYAARGWRIFPCDPNTKKPWAKRPLVGTDKDADGKAIEGSGWPKKASCDPDQIRAWWRRWPKALIGMAPGWAGAFVVDLDPKGEPVDAVEARLAEAIGHPLPAGPRTITQSGGRHLWFRRPDREVVGNDTPGLANIDIRCDHGYVIVPPSVMGNGNAYTWEELPFDGEAPDVPPALLDLIDRRGRQEAAPKHQARPAAAPPAIPREAGEEARRRYARGALDRIRTEVASTAAKRGTAVFGGACAAGRFVFHGALSEREAIAALLDAAEINGLVGTDGAASVERDIARGLEEGRRDAEEVGKRLDEVAREAEENAKRRDRWARPVDDRSEPPPWEPPSWEPHGLAAGGEDPPIPSSGEDHASSRSGGSPEEGGDDGGDLSGGAGGDLDRRCSGLPLTDLGNAQRFLLRHGGDYLFVREWGWLAWDGRRWWREGAEDRLEGAIKATVFAIADEAAAIRGTADDRVAHWKGKRRVMLSEAVANWCLKSQAAGHVNCIAGLVQSDLARATSDFDADPMKINVANGTLCIARRDGAPYVRLDDHDRRDLITKISPVVYDRAATCPQFDRFFAEVQPDVGNRRFLDQWGGLSLTGDAREQKLVFLLGKGRNGKSVWMDTVAFVAGDYAETVPIETFLDQGRARAAGAPTPELAILAGVRCLRTSEPKRGSKLDEALIKLATGGEPMKVRELNKGYFTLDVLFKMTIQGNYRPKIDGTDEGIWGRLLLVMWPVFIPKERRDLKLATKLRSEASGILNRLLDGLCDWLDHGLVVPDQVTDDTESFRNDSDPLGQYLAECTKPTLGRRVSATDNHVLFTAWARATGNTEWSMKGLTAAMIDKGFANKKSNGMWWLDLELLKMPHEFRPPEEIPLPEY